MAGPLRLSFQTLEGHPCTSAPVSAAELARVLDMEGIMEGLLKAGLPRRPRKRGESQRVELRVLARLADRLDPGLAGAKALQELLNRRNDEVDFLRQRLAAEGISVPKRGDEVDLRLVAFGSRDYDVACDAAARRHLPPKLAIATEDFRSVIADEEENHAMACELMGLDDVRVRFVVHAHITEMLWLATGTRIAAEALRISAADDPTGDLAARYLGGAKSASEPATYSKISFGLGRAGRPAGQPGEAGGAGINPPWFFGWPAGLKSGPDRLAWSKREGGVHS